MKKLLLVTTLVGSLLIVGGCTGGSAAPAAGANVSAAPAAATTTSAPAATKAAGALVSIEDKSGDDNGPGTYTYPTDKVFVPGCFDLTKFQIVDNGSAYEFKFTIATDFKNEWKNAAGWDVQMFDVYMNLGTGKHKQTLSGRHVKIAEGWDVGLIVGPDKESRMRTEMETKNSEVADDVSASENLVPDMLLPTEISTSGNTLTAKVAKNKIDLSKLNGIQVFLCGSEGYPTKSDTYNRVVNEYSAQWRLGGGNDYEGDPNVIDLLGDNSALKNYKSEEGVAEFATVNLVK